MINIIKVCDNEQLKKCLDIREKVFIIEKGVPKENDKKLNLKWWKKTWKKN